MGLDRVDEIHPRYKCDTSFYDRVRSAKRDLIESFVISPYSGRGIIVKRGQTFRVIEETGPQIADVAFWNAGDPSETFAAMRTWLVEGWIIRKYTRLWSELPFFRPMMTCVDDTVVTEPGTDFHHHFMGVHCSTEAAEMRFGQRGLNGCRLNLLQAIEPFGLTERHLRENINVHEKNRSVPETGRRTIARGDGKPGDYIEFYAEIDLIVGVSVCPFGDGLAVPTQWREGAARPLRIEVYETGIAPREFPAWTNWRAAAGHRRRP